MSDLSIRFATVRFPARRDREAAAAAEPPMRGPASTTFEGEVEAEATGQKRSPAATANRFVASNAYLPNTTTGQKLLAAAEHAQARLLDAQPLDRHTFTAALEELARSILSAPPPTSHVAAPTTLLDLRDAVWSAFYAAALARPTRIADIDRLLIWIRVLHLLAMPEARYHAVAGRIHDLRVAFPASLLEQPTDAELSAPVQKPQPGTPAGADPRIAEIDRRIATQQKAIRALEGIMDANFAQGRRVRRASVRLLEDTDVNAASLEAAPNDLARAKSHAAGPAPVKDAPEAEAELSPWRVSKDDLRSGAAGVLEALGENALSPDSPIPNLIAGLKESTARLVAERARRGVRRRIVVNGDGLLIARDHVIDAD